MKLSIAGLAACKQQRQKIAMVTAYDAASARLAEASGVDVILVGDSAAMTVFAYEDTTAMTLDDMLLLARAARRGTKEALLVADMPFESVRASDADTVSNAKRFVNEAGIDAVKIEGAGRMTSRIHAVIGSGVPVVGHIGLTPQSAAELGGYKPQGRTADSARRLLDDAAELEHAGCVAIVLEAIPPQVAAAITTSLSIPTIGIGAGVDCDGQVLVWHDMLGLGTTAEGTFKVPRFVKEYVDLRAEITNALQTYVADVRSRRFPEVRHTYAMPDEERVRFELMLHDRSATKP